MLLYRLLLHLYPAWFRAEYGKEMCAVFAARRRRESAIALWTTTFFDVSKNAILVQGDVLRQDLRWALRVLRQMPGYTATAILVISLNVDAGWEHSPSWLFCLRQSESTDCCHSRCLHALTRSECAWHSGPGDWISFSDSFDRASRFPRWDWYSQFHSAYAVAKGLTSLLFGVRPNDPLVYGAAALLVLAMTVAASFRPAIRASKIDPAITIRTE